MACKVMQVSSSAYYVWLKKPGELITADTLELFRRAKALFKASRNSLGSRELAKALRKEGFSITRYRTIKLMARLKLVVTQRLAYKVTTKRKHSDSVADNLLNMNFNPVGPNQVWAGDVSYLKTGEGWLYLAGHALNNKLMLALLNDVESWELVSVGEYKNDSTRDSILSKPKEECFESLSMWS